MKLYVYLIVGFAWAIWLLPFLIDRPREKTKPTAHDRRARWGILLQIIGYSLLWQGEFWLRAPELWRLVLSIVLFSLASLLSWTAVRALGRHLRFDAALREGHQLVRSGPYRFVRHPIYTSMFSLLLATGLLVSSWSLFGCAIVVFLAGTEIRVRIEDGLLASRFGEDFQAYKRAVSAYIPLLR